MSDAEPDQDPFALIDGEVRGIPCRRFAELPAQLSHFLHALDVHADAEFIVDGERRLTFADVKAAAATFEAVLTDQGIEPGDRVALALPNSAEWVVAFFALLSRGAVPALVNARSAAEELSHCVLSTSCKALIARPDAPKIDGDVARIDEDSVSTAIDNPANAALTLAARSEDDEAILMFTSGTTGRAKAAILTNLGVLTAIKTIQYSGLLVATDMAKRYGIELETLLEMRPPPVTLLMFPLFHVSGCHAVLLSNLTQGGKIVMMRRWNVEQALELIAQEKVTAFPAVPTMYWDLLQSAEGSDHDLSSLMQLSVGGQGTPKALLDAVRGGFPAAVLGTGYGMTEANGTVSMVVGEAFLEKPHSTGKPIATMDVQVRDERGQVLPPNDVGEIFVRGATLMAGYANAPSPFDANGWLGTGDVGYLDEDGELCIVDRLTDMVISGGENIYCAEVERALDLHPAVVESAALGEPDERLGERVVAVVVVSDPTSGTTEADILASLDDQLARYKVPKRLVLTSEPLPRNATSKIIKPAVRELYLTE